MQRIILILMVGLFVYISSAAGQSFRDPYRYPEQNQVMGGVGMTWLDGQPYTTLTIAPDLAFGKFGIGIYLQLLFDNNNSLKFRKDEYKGGAGILRAIRYMRLGQKYDPYYVRVGSLERATLANGFLVWNYNNGSNYDKRKIGLELDGDLDKFGFESVWSSIGTSNLRGANFYIRPLRLFNQNIPVLDKFRIYTTYVRDSKVRVSAANADSTEVIDAISVGADLQWLDLPLVKSTIYFDFSEFDGYGNGKATGINVLFPEFIGLFGLSAKFEKRFIGEQFIPSYFGPLYELDQQVGTIDRLKNAPKAEGYFGELAGHIVNQIRLIGSFQKLNGIDNSGVLHLEASAPTLVPKFDLRGYYDKRAIGSFKDARTLDSNSLLTAELGYQVYPYVFLTMVYRWYWVEQPEDSGIFKPIERVEPRVTFRYNF